MQVFLNSSCLKSVFEKLRFRDGLLSVDGTPNRRNKAAFLNVFRVVWTGSEVGDWLVKIFLMYRTRETVYYHIST